MKKILFATTALVATASVAAADVTFGGAGRFGVEYNEGAAQETFITSRLTLNVDATAESDAGVEFGVRVRLRQDDGATSGFNGPRFYVSSGGLEVGVGNIYGAIDSMPGLYSGSVGLTGLGYGNVVSNFGSHAYDSNGTGAGSSREALEVMYSMGDYSAHVSHDGSTTEAVVSATFSGWTVGAGISDGSGTDWVLTAGGNIGPANVGLAVAEDGANNQSITLSGSFDVGAATNATAYIAKDEGETDDMAYGIGATHDLGGGTSLRGGVVSLHGQTQADFGVNFNF